MKWKDLLAVQRRSSHLKREPRKASPQSSEPRGFMSSASPQETNPAAIITTNYGANQHMHMCHLPLSDRRKNKSYGSLPISSRKRSQPQSSLSYYGYRAEVPLAHEATRGDNGAQNRYKTRQLVVLIETICVVVQKKKLVEQGITAYQR